MRSMNKCIIMKTSSKMIKKKNVQSLMKSIILFINALY